ncbi:hypothetical protein CVO96_07955 [Deinococcus koreensis]|uniref:Uncharacterized protein n=2 Tax=Deinococcus koreensis TaxID=2054903 RepID=A0A2K3V2B0_9DEIO|nr:hypothetical protein CVO96_07955 [Deinococcus koreensis]
MLGDLVSPRALERILQDAAEARGTTPAELDGPALEDILKREVFKRLQLTVPAPLAKKRVSEVLDELMKATQERSVPSVSAASLGALEDGARRFSLYFDWPETQRLRSLLGIARQEEGQGRDVSALVQEGQDLIVQLERRLQESLVEQAQDLAEMRAAFTRVQGMGSREVRRLETLIGQIDEAQTQGTLLPGEVERARTLTFSLRKLLESSVVQTVSAPGGAPPPLDPEAQARVLALEQEHNAQQLLTLERDFAALLSARPELQARHAEVRAAQQAGGLDTEAVERWRGELKLGRDALLAEQRGEFAGLEQQLTPFTTSGELATGLRVLLDATRQTLELGNLATDSLRELRATQEALGEGGEGGTRLALQQELLDLERSARNVPAAQAELEPLLAQAQAQLSAGQEVDLSAPWALLERHMGAAAQERENLDLRADTVIREYDAVRHLAGETTQRLGRLADSLRAQRRLGSMSIQARTRYAQSLQDAEILLAEAHAEYRAAQEVTASFGQDALSGLLDVFDLGGGSEPAGLDVPSAPAAAAPLPTPAPAATSINDLLSGLSGFGAPASAPQAQESQPPLPAHSWLIQGGRMTAGQPDAALGTMTALLEQAQTLGLQRLDMADAAQVWSARRTAGGDWRLARAADWDALDTQSGAWLDGA